MLERLAGVIVQCTRALDDYDHTGALTAAEEFFWFFCDDYLELVKGRAYGERGEGPGASARAALRLALAVILRLFAPFAFFTYNDHGADLTTWRGSPWFFIGWQLALCVTAVLVALLRGAEGPVRARIIRALAITGAAAVIMLVLAGTGGFTHAVTA